MKDIYIVNEFQKEIEKWFGKMTMIIYGSVVYGVNTSDLDVCFITDQMQTKDEFKRLEEVIKNFHYKNNLRVDEEVPYGNKLIYTPLFVNETLKHLPFPYLDDKYVIPPIRKDVEFLSSVDMKKRLLLNILTVNNIVINGNNLGVNNKKNLAWEQIIKTVISYCEMDNFSIDDLLCCLYQDPFTKEEGEMYLGYKNNTKEKEMYLESEVTRQVSHLEQGKKLVKTLNNKYKTSESWLNNARN